MARLLFCFLLFSAPAFGQFISVAGGGVFSQDRAQAFGAGAESSDFTRSGIITADAGAGVLPFLSVALHYSFARPELFLQRPARRPYVSSALLDVGTHTVTLDGRLRSPEFGGLRVYGLVGGGFSRSNLTIRQLVENPFPGSPPNSETYPVFTFGGGVEQRLAPLVRLKAEVRDYLSPIPERFFSPGGIWHRVVVVGGVTIGR